MKQNTTIVVGFSINPELWFKSEKTQDPEKKQISDYGLSVAGSSANIAQALNKLGCSAEIIGAVGKDDFPSLLLESELKKRNIHFHPLQILDATNIAFVPFEISNSSIVHGKKGNLDTKKLPECKETIRANKAQWRIASSIRFEEVPLAIDLLDKEYVGYRTLNFKSATITGGRTIARNMLENTDLLILNQYEYDCFKANGPEELLKHGPRILIVTNGNDGGHCYTDSFSFKYDSKIFSTENATTGAGDWFHAGFIRSLIEQETNIIDASKNKEVLEKAAEFAALVAGKKVLFHGGGNGPTIDMLY